MDTKIYNPYSELNSKGSWLKANFHCHTGTGAGTCGMHPFADVISAYQRAEYDLLSVSNHNLYSDVSCYNDKITLIDAVEYSREPHMLTIGVKEYFDCEHQQAIDKTNYANGFVILCHPNWMRQEYFNKDFALQLQGYTGIEIINPLIYRLSGSGLATDVWDYLLSNGKRVWGFGNDDFHDFVDLGRAATYIYATSKDYADVKSAIDKGLTFVSTGLVLDSFELADNAIKVKAMYRKPSYICEFTYSFYGKYGRLLHQTTDVDAKYTISGDEMYVRVEVTDESGAKLFTQPVMLF